MLASLLVALLLDALYPFHRGLLLKIHPVHTSFVMARKLGKPGSSRRRGVAVWLLVVASHTFTAMLLLYASYTISPFIWILIAGFITKTSLSLRLLLEIGFNAYQAYLGKNPSEYRWWAQQLVRRNVWLLGEDHVASAVIESLAESLVDGYTSPLTYYAFLGPLGAFFQRIVNTLDSALGYRDPEYLEVGWFSARMDDIINFIPARLTALLIIAASTVRGNGWREALQAWKKYRRSVESINAGHPMSAMAGLLAVKLEKPGHYSINKESPLPAPEKIIDALWATGVTALAYTLIVVLVIVLVGLL